MHSGKPLYMICYLAVLPRKLLINAFDSSVLCQFVFYEILKLSLTIPHEVEVYVVLALIWFRDLQKHSFWKTFIISNLVLRLPFPYWTSTAFIRWDENQCGDFDYYFHLLVVCFLIFPAISISSQNWKFPSFDCFLNPKRSQNFHIV